MKAAFLVVSMLSPVLLSSQERGARVDAPSETQGGTRLATLHALDPLSRTLCLKDGQPGGGFQNNEVRNRCSDIDFDSYNSGSFTVGIEGGRQGNIIDLGTADDLMKKYGYEETVGKMLTRSPWATREERARHRPVPRLTLIRLRRVVSDL